MKICVLVFLSCVALCVTGEEKYTSRFDNLDINAILDNPRVLKHYVKCVLDTGPCTREGRELRKHIPEALATSCRKCTDSQKKFIRVATASLRQKQPDYFNLIVNKFDPDRMRLPEFEKFLNPQ